MKKEITLDNFENASINLKTKDTTIIVLVMDSCISCKNYTTELDNKNISYSYLKCNNTNMPIITLIAKSLNITNLKVPIVLKYINGKFSSRLK